MNKKYNLRLDLQFRCNNSLMKFRQSDNKTSDFFIQITRAGQQINIDNAIVILAVVKPSGLVQSQFLEVKDNKVYADLQKGLKDEIGTYKAQALLIYQDERVSTDVIEYEVLEDDILNQLAHEVKESEDVIVLGEILSRLSEIELQEDKRLSNEVDRVEAEKIRERTIEQLKSDINNLIANTNKKVDNNLNTNASKIDNLVIEAKEELNEYKNDKDASIDEDLREFKENTNKSIENYKTSKDIEINNILNSYKTDTTNDINNFKNTVNSKIDKYKNDKDKAINEYIEAKELELDNYVEAKDREIDEYKTSKNNELDLYVSEKNTLINSKISEVDATKKQLQNSVNNKLVEVDNAENQRQQEHE